MRLGASHLVALAVPVSVLAALVWFLKPTPEPVLKQPPSVKWARSELRLARDDGARVIESDPKRMNLDEMLALPRPTQLTGGKHHSRVAPFETSLWRVSAKVVETTVRPDGDFYLVIESPSGARTVAEVPDPQLLDKSHFRSGIMAVRAEVARRLHPSAQPSKADARVELTGIGFFGAPSKKTNGARLNPVINIRFLD